MSEAVRVERKHDCQDGRHFELFHAHDDDVAWASVCGALGPDALFSEERWGPVYTRTATIPFQLELRVGERPGKVAIVFRVNTSLRTRALWLAHVAEVFEQPSPGSSKTPGPAREPAYFDHAASTPCDPRVIAELSRALSELGHPDATHGHGRAAKARLEASERTIAEAVGGGEVIWTSGATEANARALATGLRFVTTRAEHPSVLEPLTGREVVYAPLDRDGLVDVDAVVAAAAAGPCVVSLAHACSVTGVLQPIVELAERLPADAWLHVDAAQSFTRDEGVLQHPRLDAITVSAHKIGGPVGIGALVVRREGRVAPRKGTAPVALATAFSLATRLALDEAHERRAACEAVGRDLRDALEPLGAAPVSRAKALPHVLCTRFVGLDARAVQLALAPVMSVSLGSACRAASPEPSEALLAMGLSRTEAREALRFSWCASSAVPDLTSVAASLRASRHARWETLVTKPNGVA
ncbi:MAG: aminotransferase class V-fold PLP-dependent enzyme [Sandaracinus sp.]|nr:aminotransferase class V-fold PLP-dependent enzyme [Sandaracinus sp.]MCB9613903.1 aminotransferase class V-fold PLP-dependent enzyme [Sandaracinus sp.]MCB9634139.1 aminotransferase class V-fold PLP-dependent enzyme [Sandaracinus sp.]